MQSLAFKEAVRRIEGGERVVWGDIMRDVGYSDITAKNPGKNLLEKDAFKILLTTISDEVILGRLVQILVDEDKRSSLTAADMLLKLKDRYPDKRLRIGPYTEQLENLG